MKIAEVTSTFPPYKGGMGNVAYYNAWSLATLGHEVTVFTPKYYKIKKDEELPFAVKRLRPWFKYGNAGILPQLWWHLPKFDVVHLHYPFFGGAETIYFLDKIKDIKLVVTYHMDVVGTGLMAKFFKWHTQYVLPKILDRADKIIVTSKDYANFSNLSGRLKTESEKFVEIPCGVNHLLYKPRPKDTELLKKYDLYDKKVILFVGGLDKAHYFKGINVLIQAMQAFSDSDDVRCLIVGDGELRSSYQSMVDSFGLAKKIIFTGFIGDNMLPKFYNLADIFVLPSIDKSEAFGIVALEAMASAKPVIASDLPGVRSVVDKQKTGLLVKPGSVDNLVAMLKTLLVKNQLRTDYGLAGREKVLQKYTWEKVGYKLDNVFKDCLEKK
ncbi:glycosyltransferase family 4 protein [Candidatus Nomurabacteria bacterium]|nr:glycosyltransferase family 4 protein [Candidatus Nomurabacteria bacterium]